MILNSIRLKNFRNYETANLSPDKGLNIFVGDNAQGKTNILEAVSLLTKAQSFRNVKNYSDYVLNNSNESAARVSGQIQFQNSDIVMRNVDILINNHKKEIILDKKNISKNQFAKKFGLVTFSPDTLNIIKNGPSVRRKLIEDLMISLNWEVHDELNDLNKILKTRNQLLKKYANDELVDSVFFEVINEKYLPLATKIAFRKITAIRQSLPFIESIFRQITGVKNAEISIDYLISEKSAIDWSENQVYDVQSSRIKHLLKAERAFGQTLVGPHKHDIVINIDGRDSRYFGSQGQQRSTALAIKIAQVEALKQTFEEPPILILDDVLSELDIEKQENLIHLVSQLNGQIFLSTTNIEYLKLFKTKNIKEFKIINGEIKNQDGNSVRTSSEYA
jgi:DNA replication and repair protein RecF